MTTVPPAVMAAVLACTDRTIPTPRRPKETPMTTQGTDVAGLAPQIHRGEAMSETDEQIAKLLERAHVVHLEPDDQIIIEVESDLFGQELAERLVDAFPGRSVLVMAPGVRLAGLRSLEVAETAEASR
ncbi:MAG: hypothetical protein JWO67_2237 [Streptosporangiaceae bacterium]|nr:hypothetical protein [Streptosporangiaceae bacterium]